ncbi:MAG: DNA-binding protein WhiA [Firmicutes bacterium]|nr:DNA-binding protein WhiA [Bacillota bacterium]
MSRISFSAGVKSELCKKTGPDRDSRKAELAALVNTLGKVNEEPLTIFFGHEQQGIIKKVFTLTEKLFTIELLLGEGSGVYTASLEDPDQVRRMLEQLGLWQHGHYVRRVPTEWLGTIPGQQAYVRGAFLGAGSITNPKKTYHIEFLSTDPGHLEELQDLMHNFDLDMRLTERSTRQTYVLYLKNSDQILDLLNVMQAYTALMDLANVQIEKRVRNEINRSVNCEAANLQKVVSAALKQVDDINYLVSHLGWEGLPAPLATIARLRLQNQDASLQELGEMLDPPVGRSGVNHRLRKLSQMAEEVRRAAHDL